MKRLKPVRRTPSKLGTVLPSLKPASAQRNIASLISRWENISNNILTPAVINRPRPDTEAASQSEGVFQRKVGLKSDFQLDEKLEKGEVSNKTSNQKPLLRKC